MVGKTVLVNKCSDGNGNIDPHRKEVQTIVAAYQDGRVKTQTGDVWTVKPHGDSGIDFITVV